MNKMMTYNPGKVCGMCKYCGLRKIPVDVKIRDNIPVEFIYDIYCSVDDTSLSGTHSKKAELCHTYTERSSNYDIGTPELKCESL